MNDRRFFQAHAKLKLASFVMTVLVTLFFNQAKGAILFEGWSKVLLNDIHKGLVVQRIEFDESKKQFKSAHYLKAGSDDSDMVESLVAIADEKMNPVSFHYTGVIDKKPVSVIGQISLDKTKAKPGKQKSKGSEAQVSEGPLVLTAEVKEGDKVKKVTQVLPEGAFLSTFLGYVMLQRKDGIKKGVKYSYNAILEESATLVKGEAFIADEQPHKGIPAFRVSNTLQGAKYLSYITGKAEVLHTNSPTQGVSTELVASRKEAEGPVKVSDAVLKAVFAGIVPTGLQNELARRAGVPPSNPTEKAKE